jgi:thiamine kinase-like enzyme
VSSLIAPILKDVCLTGLKINETLTYARTKHSTLTHGDVKGANIVFSQVPFRKPSSDALPLTCALYDLQYVGVNPPTHDLVYFLGTSVSSPLINSAENERELLDFYFAELSASLPAGVSYPRPVFDAHWDLSVVDWVRFMAGWGYWGNDQWATRRAKEIVQGWGAGGFTCLRDALSL